MIREEQLRPSQGAMRDIRVLMAYGGIVIRNDDTHIRYVVWSDDHQGQRGFVVWMLQTTQTPPADSDLIYEGVRYDVLTGNVIDFVPVQNTKPSMSLVAALRALYRLHQPTIRPAVPDLRRERRLRYSKPQWWLN